MRGSRDAGEMRWDANGVRGGCEEKAPGLKPGRYNGKGKNKVKGTGLKTRRYTAKATQMRLAAVDRGVADVLALDDVDYVFGDVGGMVADAFQIFGNQD